ncbi:MAG: sulfatase/phosphatase domain-containing protein [Verrucomicrobiales bacterium]
MRAKPRYFYEHSMRAPFIVRGPGVPAGKESHALTYLYDLHATVLKLSQGQSERTDKGATASPVASQSLVPLWRGDKNVARDALLLAFTNTMRAVRDSRWKLIVYPPINHAQLFDLLTDPHEMNDLASRHPERVAALMKRLSDLQAASGDQQPLRVAKPKLKEINLSGRKANPHAAIPGGANR